MTTTTDIANALVFASQLNAALARAHCAAEIVAAEHLEFSLELYLDSPIGHLDPSDLPMIRALAIALGPGISRGTSLSPATTVVEMTRDIRRACQELAEQVRLAVEADDAGTRNHLHVA